MSSPAIYTRRFLSNRLPLIFQGNTPKEKKNIEAHQSISQRY